MRWKDLEKMTEEERISAVAEEILFWENMDLEEGEKELSEEDARIKAKKMDREGEDGPRGL